MVFMTVRAEVIRPENSRRAKHTGQRTDEAVLRRKVQNKLNQRASRRRRAEDEGRHGLIIRQWVPNKADKAKRQATMTDALYCDTTEEGNPSTLNSGHSSHGGSSSSSSPSSSSNELQSYVEQSDQNENTKREYQLRIVALDTSWRKALEQHRRLYGTKEPSTSPVYSQDVRSSLAYQAREVFAIHSLPADHLLSLIYFNVFRAFSTLITLMGLNERQMCDDDYPSPFMPLSPSASSAITRLPASLRPTALQRSVEHHPFVDIFPDSVVRDNILENYREVCNLEAVCLDLVGLGENNDCFLQLDEGPRRGVTVWGDPWDPDSWEISETLALKQGWMFKGAFELEASTNSRRRNRGWTQLRFA